MNFIVTKFDKEKFFQKGRAGMEYQTGSSRLGGKFIASHTHTHRRTSSRLRPFSQNSFQMIYCLSGWAEIGLYEDQGGAICYE